MKRDLPYQPKVHTVHEKFVHLTTCGAGVNGMITGNIHKAIHACKLCEKGK